MLSGRSFFGKFKRMDKTKLLKRSAWGLVGMLLLIQVIRPTLGNPSISAEPKWDSPRTRELVQRACFDCHSNQVRYPWYSQVAPVRWLLWNHVQEGREKLNFSQPDSDVDADDIVEAIRSNEMPLWDYSLLHPASRLTPAEKDSLVVGVLRTFGNEADSNSESDSTEVVDKPGRAGEREEKEDRD